MSAAMARVDIIDTIEMKVDSTTGPIDARTDTEATKGTEGTKREGTTTDAIGDLNLRREKEGGGTATTGMVKIDGTTAIERETAEGTITKETEIIGNIIAIEKETAIRGDIR